LRRKEEILYSAQYRWKKILAHEKSTNDVQQEEQIQKAK
jgi:hypothetical protein